LMKHRKLIEMQSDERIKAIYKNLAKNKKVKWKESIKKL
jgi:hypothetical protein